jgi:cold shock CspA family protein
MTKQINKWMSAVAGVAGGMLTLQMGGAVQAAPAVTQSVTNTATGQTKTQLVHAVATVKSVNHGDRSITLKKEDGEEMTVHVPESVKGIETVKPGDKVDVDYYASMAISMAPAGTKPSMTERKGQSVDMGGGISGRELKMSAEVVSVDPAANTVTFKGPKGNMRTVYVADPANQEKLPSLKPGQVVQFDYTEAVAASIHASGK